MNADIVEVVPLEGEFSLLFQSAEQCIDSVQEEDERSTHRRCSDDRTRFAFVKLEGWKPDWPENSRSCVRVRQTTHNLQNSAEHTRPLARRFMVFEHSHL